VIKTRQDINQFINQHSDQLAQQVMQRSQRWYEKLEDAAEQEFLIPATERQINEALQKFVVKNVNAIMDLSLELHDGWLRLYATVNIKGIFAKLAVNLSLVHVQLDRHRQRFVFSQLSDTDVIALYTDSYLKTKGVDIALWWFHKVIKKDPLGLILGKINLTRQKEDILYLDIGRWLKKNKKIMDTLRKVQVNHGFLAEQQLVLKANANIADALNIGTGKQVITDADNPANAKIDDSETVLTKTPKPDAPTTDQTTVDTLSDNDLTKHPTQETRARTSTEAV
jgi:hypothetical protein